MTAARTPRAGADRWLLGGVFAIIALLSLVLVAGYWLGTADDDLVPATTSDFSDPTLIQRGAYLALAGNCVTCHTAPGGQEYAGGRAVPTPFGTLYGSNLTPDEATGIGSWTPDDFWRALHNGKSRNGDLLYPAFPYPNYTNVTRADADALYAYLRSIPPASRENTPNTLRFPYNQRFSLAYWRALYFRPGAYRDDPSHEAAWNRGAYLVNGLTHCAACHTPRNGLGATRSNATLAGGTIPMLDWYAPPLSANRPHGLGDWTTEQIAALLKTGISERGTASGPMAEVVFQSLQYLSDGDIEAIAGYLKTLPESREQAIAASQADRMPGAAGMLAQGQKIYEAQCVDCHGANGEGRYPAYPRLAGNMSVMAPDAVNAIQAILNGGFPPGTAGNPQPYGMPPFRQSLSDSDVAAVTTYIRASWGNDAAAVSPSDVRRYRTIR